MPNLSPEVIREAVAETGGWSERSMECMETIVTAALAYAALIEAPALGLVWKEIDSDHIWQAGEELRFYTIYKSEGLYLAQCRPHECASFGVYNTLAEAQSMCVSDWQQYVRALLNLGDGKGVG